MVIIALATDLDGPTPLEPVKNLDFNYDAIDLVGNDFPDFFKLRPQNLLEPDLSFMTELEKTKVKFEHEHAKREHPLKQGKHQRPVLKKT
jgi:hypothetical protein